VHELQGQVGELRLTLQITRAATGKTETVELVGFVDEEKLKELQHGSNPLDGGAQRSD
tara:strand:- start:20446 stop:20619 length:174 start_codon:yes stop_codon:yes gene_type:complete